ncbi:MAG: hypothetical protein ACK5BL_04710 [Flavobacteriales bacterium]|jgi:hypothetical protein
MKTTTILFCLCAFLCTSQQASAQFVLSTAADSVQIFTQWGKEKPMKKESPKVLLMRIENANPQPVEVSFEINFIDELRVVETSNVQIVKIAASKAGKPKKVKLKFKPAKYNPEDVDGVDVSIEEVKVQ